MIEGLGFALLLFGLGVLLNAFFAGYETGFVASNPIRIRYLAERERQPNALRLLAYVEKPDRMITLVLIGTNLAMVMGTIAIARALQNDLWSTLIATPAFLILGEVMPKSIFRIHPTRLALGFLPVISFFDAVLAPVVIPVTWISQRFLSLVGGEQRDIRKLMTSLEDMRILVDESASHGAIDLEEKEMIHSVIDLHSRQANEIMVPRIDIEALPETATRTELLTLLTESGRTRIAIYRETIDEIIGVVNAFDVLTDTSAQDESIRRYIRTVLHLPDSIKLDDALKSMRSAKQPMAILVDEYGGTDGLIAMEDILEEIFGEIHDEYDKMERQIRKVGKNAYVVDARASLWDLSERLKIQIVDEEVETVGGWLMRLTRRIPAKGEVIEHERFRITVLDGGGNHVASIRLEVLPESKETP
jgi:putative hemolysin